MKLTFEVSPAPKNANRKRGRHWGASKAERKRVGYEIWAQVAQLRGQWHRAESVSGRTVPFPLPYMGRVTVHYHYHGYNRLDDAGVIEAGKPVLDALVTEGIIEDDRPPFVKHGPVTQTVVRNRPGWSQLEVTLEEL